MTSLFHFFACTAIMLASNHSEQANVKTAWEQWLAKPNPTTANKVSTIEYSSPDHDEDQRTTRELRTLYRHIQNNQTEAIRLALRLTQTTAPGHQLEELHDMLGHASRYRTANYLRALAAEPDISDCPGVDFLGERFVDRPTKRTAEIQARRQILNKIKNPKLIETRNRCLRILEQENS